MLLKHGEFNLAVGVDWAMPGSQGEANAMRREHNKLDFVFVQHGRQLLLGTHESLKQSPVYSGALLVALVKPNAIVIHPVDERHVWVCAVIDGLPAVGYDKIFTREEGREKVIEWSSAYFTNAEIIGDMVGANSDFPSLLAHIAELIKGKSLKKKQLNETALRKNGGAVKRLVVLAIICVAIGAGYFAHLRHKAFEKEQMAESESKSQSSKKAYEILQSQAQREAARAANLQKMSADVAAAKKIMMERLSIVDMYSAFDATRKSMPISLHGFRPQRIECGSTACRVAWMGSGRFTKMADKFMLPNVERAYTADLTAFSVFPFTTKTEEVPAVPAGIENVEQLMFWLRNAFSSATNPAVFDAPVANTVTPPADSGLQAVEVGSSGKLRMTLQGAGALIELANTFKSLSEFPIRVTTIKYAIAGAPSIEIEGEYIFLKGK